MTDTFDEYRPMRVALPLREALAAYLVGGVEWGQTQAAARGEIRADALLALILRGIGTAQPE